MSKTIKDMTLAERVQLAKKNKDGKVKITNRVNPVESVEDKITNATSVDDLKDLLIDAMNGKLKPKTEIRSVITRNGITIDNIKE